MFNARANIGTKAGKLRIKAITAELVVIEHLLKSRSKNAETDN